MQTTEYSSNEALYASVEYGRQIKDMTLFTDRFMTKFFEDNIKDTQLLLSIILMRDDLIVEQVRTQEPKTIYGGHSVRLDVSARDDKGVHYDIEIQNADDGADPKRARYFSSVIDTSLLESGKSYNTLNESYVIFITENDVMKAGKALYHIDRTIAEIDHASFGDESHIIYVNGAYKSSSENDPYIQVSNLVHDMKCKEASQMRIGQLAETFKFFKGTAEGVKTMSDVLRELVAESEERGRREGENVGTQKKAQEVAVGMASEGISLETIAKIVKYPVDTIKMWINNPMARV